MIANTDTELCVVGDDDQAIYQWRGSDVNNIVEFASRYEPVTKFEIATNRRSCPEIIEAANGFAQSIPNRLAKEMNPSRPTDGSSPRVVVWREQDERAEAGRIANLVLDLNEAAVPFRDIGVLVPHHTVGQFDKEPCLPGPSQSPAGPVVSVLLR